MVTVSLNHLNKVTAWQGVFPDGARVCRAGLPVFSHPVKRVFRVRDIAGEDQVLLDDPVADRERAPEPDVSGSTSRGCGCWPVARSSSKPQSMESSSIGI